MNEIERINKNIKGEIPKGEKTIIRIGNLKNPKESLDTAKATISAFLNNMAIQDDSEDWYELLPQKIVKFLAQLDQEDLKNDELLYPLDILIYELKNKDWEWYSSKLLKDGFEIVTTNSFLPRYTWIFHCQNIPLSNIWIEDDRFGKYGLQTLRDVTTYKNFYLE